MTEQNADYVRLRAALQSIARYDPRWKGAHVNDAPNRQRLIERAYDALFPPAQIMSAVTDANDIPPGFWVASNVADQRLEWGRGSQVMGDYIEPENLDDLVHEEMVEWVNKP